MTEKEIFDCPSRFARICEALYQYALSTRTTIWYVNLWHSSFHPIDISGRTDVVKPTIHDLMIAPTDRQRIKYAHHLFVYAKEKTSMPLRLADLVDKYQVRS